MGGGVGVLMGVITRGFCSLLDLCYFCFTFFFTVLRYIGFGDGVYFYFCFCLCIV